MIAALCFCASALLWTCAMVRFRQAHGKRASYDWQWHLKTVNQACWFGVGGMVWGVLGCASESVEIVSLLAQAQ